MRLTRKNQLGESKYIIQSKVSLSKCLSLWSRSLNVRGWASECLMSPYIYICVYSKNKGVRGADLVADQAVAWKREWPSSVYLSLSLLGTIQDHPLTKITAQLCVSNPFRHLLQLHHVHGGLFRGAHCSGSQLPPPFSRYSWNASLGKSAFFIFFSNYFLYKFKSDEFNFLRQFLQCWENWPLLLLASHRTFVN